MKDKFSNFISSNKPTIDEFGEIEFLLKELKYSKDQVDDSLKNRKYDEIMATYMLLATKSTEVFLFTFFHLKQIPFFLGYSVP